MKNEPHKKPYPVERYLQRIRDFYAKNGRAPKSEECERGQSTNKHLIKHYGSWQLAVEAAIGIRPKYREMSDDDVMQLLIDMCNKKNRLPHTDDFYRKDIQLIYKRFTNVTLANEKIFGDSVRLRALRALQELTPSGVDNATTVEISELVNKQGTIVPLFSVRGLLEYSRKENFVVSGKYDKATWWSLTSAGNQFINSFKGKKDGNRAQ